MAQTRHPRLAVALLTFNRFHLCKETYYSMLPSLPEGATTIVLDGGSTLPEQRLWVLNRPHGFVLDKVGTVGAAQTSAIDLAVDHFKLDHNGEPPDIVVFTADDYLYRPGWAADLAAFWAAADPSIAIASLNWEPSYPWNHIIGTARVGGQPTLFRATVPGSSWSFRASSWRTLFGPLEDKTGGEDLTVCQALLANGYKLAALDLTRHIGEQESAWGNMSWQRALPLMIDERNFSEPVGRNLDQGFLG